jgi:hypothetical protein
MRRENLIRCIVVATFGVGLLGATASAGTYRVVSPETYDGVLNSVFRTSESDSHYIYRIIIRLRPTFAAESEIVITREANRVRGEMLVADANVHRRLNELKKHGGKESVMGMATLIHVKQIPMTLSASDADRWRDRIIADIPETIETLKHRSDIEANDHTAEIALDGTLYEIAYESGRDSVKLGINDSEIDSSQVTGDFKLVRAVNELRLSISGSKKVGGPGF